jgi:hypothetical protein
MSNEDRFDRHEVNYIPQLGRHTTRDRMSTPEGQAEFARFAERIGRQMAEYIAGMHTDAQQMGRVPKSTPQNNQHNRGFKTRHKQSRKHQPR